MSSDQTSTRNRILAASLKLLEQDGAQKVRMQDIAKTAGISRQALYIHFKSRVDLLVATTHYGDEVRGVDERLRIWEEATTGLDRLEAWVEVWGNHIQEIYPVARALLVARETDEAAEHAWNERMDAVRSKCVDTIDALVRDGKLANEWTREEAIDLLWSMLSIRNWEHLTQDCGWSVDLYVLRMKKLVRRSLVA